MMTIHPINNSLVTQNNTSFNGKTTKNMRMLYVKSLKKTKVDAIINNEKLPFAEKVEQLKNMADSKLAKMSLFDKLMSVFKK